MKLGSIRSFGAATFLLATATLIPSTAIAADPLLPNAAAWVAIADDNGNKWITGGDHRSIRLSAGQRVLAWLDARAAGRPMTSTCG